MSEVFNVIGPSNLVTETIQTFTVHPQHRIVRDEFQPSDPSKRDVNLEIEDDKVDAFYDWCEEKGLEFQLQ